MLIRRFILFLFFAAISIISMVAQKDGINSESTQKAIEKHYEYLENETKNLRESVRAENEAFRKFIQEERAAHQNFLENSYKTVLIIGSVLAAILVFFGLNTFNGIKESRKDLEAIAAARLLAFEESMRGYKAKFEEAQQKLTSAEKEYNRFLSYYKDVDPRQGRYVLIGEKAKIDQMKQQEIPRFEAALGTIEFLDSAEMTEKGAYLMPYDVIIYRSSANAQGEDAVLEKLMADLQHEHPVPILVYAVGQSEFIKGTTDIALKHYGLFHIANNLVTLIDNTASTYRVSKLVGKSKA